MTAKVIEIHLPEYHLGNKPDYLALGQKVDDVIKQNFPDGSYLCRAVGKDDHPQYSLDELVDIILKLCTDKYNSQRKEVCHEEFASYNHDLQARLFTIKNGQIVLNNSYEYPTMFGDLVKKYYKNALLDRGYRVRLDILIIYRADQLVQVRQVKPSLRVRPELENYLWEFKYPFKKREALIGVVKILRN